MTGSALAQSPIAPPATVDAAAASRMRAGLALLMDEKNAAENRAIQNQGDADRLQAELDAANVKLQALQKQLDALKPADAKP